MGENIDPTWLACSGRAPLDRAMVEAGMARVERHYSRLVDYPLRVSSAAAGHSCVAIAGDAEPRCRWPHFAEDEELAIATAYAPAGWSRLVGGEVGQAPLALARLIADDPAAVIRALSPPSAIAVLERGSGSLVVVNDAIGAARAFTLRAGEVTLWSNRPGALAIFAGLRPAADEAAWRLLAGAGWPLGGASPIEGITRLGPGTICRADAAGAVTSEPSNAIRSLVAPDASWRELAEPAGAQMVSQAREVASLWPGEADVDLSGGRDSRVSAAATIAAGIDARYLTSNAMPGEGKVARELMALQGGDLEHRIRRRKEGSATPGTPLLERAANLHLLHDGVRHPQKLRGKMTLPRPRPERAKFSGHGGELAHAFFYKSRSDIRRLRFRPGALEERLRRFFRHGHDATSAEARAATLGEVERVLDEGRELGLRGPALLDWFYLVDRFTHRTGVATDSERTSLFAVPAAFAAAFAMSPLERIKGRLHSRLVAQFVPAWDGVGYFQPTEKRIARTKRERLWEVPEDVVVVEEILAAGGSWTELWDRDVALREWQALRAGEGNRKAENLFEGIVYRASFDRHLDELARAAKS